MEKYVLTGGPCTGKTTILEQLAKKGFGTIPEVAREIFKEELAKEATDLCYKGVFPNTSLYGFEKLVIDRQFFNEEKTSNGIYVLDRSIVDPIAYAEIGRIELGNDIYQQIKYANYKKVFFLEQLPLYMQDKERKEDPKQAKQLHEKLYETYHKLGLDIVKVPPIGIERRVEFILKHIKS